MKNGKFKVHCFIWSRCDSLVLMVSGLQNLVAAAERGSIEGLQQIIALVPECTLPQIKRLLPVFSHRALNPTKGSEGVPTALDPAILPLKGFIKFAIHFLEVFPKDDVSELTKFWTNNIWPCIQRLFKNVVERVNESDNDGRNQVLTTIIDLLFFFASESWLLEIVGGTPGAVGLLIKLWTMEAHDPDYFLTSSTYDITPSKALEVYITWYSIEGHNLDWDEEVLNPANGGAGSLAFAALEHLRVQDNIQNKTDILRVTDSLRITKALSCHISIRSVLTTSHSFSAITRVLTSVTSQPYSAPTAYAVCSCIIECCDYLISWLEIANGVSNIQEVLEARLLPALVKSDPWLSKFDKSHSTMHLPLLESVLPKYLIYRSVVRMVTKSLKSIDVLGTEEKMVRGTPFWLAWLLFKETAANRSRIDKDMEIGNVGRMMCGNLKVSVYILSFLTTTLI
jgi:hypothetical protein